MSLTERSIQLESASLDQELAALQHAVDTARHNRWHGGDVLEPEFENFLAALTKPSRIPASKLDPGPEWRNHRNSWREAIDRTS